MHDPAKPQALSLQVHAVINTDCYHQCEAHDVCLARGSDSHGLEGGLALRFRSTARNFFAQSFSIQAHGNKRSYRRSMATAPTLPPLAKPSPNNS